MNTSWIEFLDSKYTPQEERRGHCGYIVYRQTFADVYRTGFQWGNENEIELAK